MAGFLIAVFPALDGVLGLSSGFLAFVPLLFAGVVVGLYSAATHGANLQRSSVVGAGIGVLVMLAPTVLLVQSGPKPAVAAFIIGVPAVVGFGVFTLFVASLLWAAPDNGNRRSNARKTSGISTMGCSGHVRSTMDFRRTRHRAGR